jgi:hypothetical protein
MIYMLINLMTKKGIMYRMYAVNRIKILIRINKIMIINNKIILRMVSQLKYQWVVILVIINKV